MGTIFCKEIFFLRKKCFEQKLKKKLFGPNLHQAKYGVVSFLVFLGQKIKVAQNDLKHILVLEFLKSN